jgi:hypothetical protein
MAVAVVDGDKGVLKTVGGILDGWAEFHCCRCFEASGGALEAIPKFGGQDCPRWDCAAGPLRHPMRPGAAGAPAVEKNAPKILAYRPGKRR